VIALADLPALNAVLNATSAVLVIAGYGCIRTGHKRAHAVFMASAVIVSLVFLISYLTYHAHIGSKHFEGQGSVRPVYFAILISHTILAAVTALWLVPVTIYRAARSRFDRHKSIARWTFPVWLYVSVTGVVIYFMLYHWYARA
jgi:putative membrane protein